MSVIRNGTIEYKISDRKYRLVFSYQHVSQYISQYGSFKSNKFDVDGQCTTNKLKEITYWHE